MHDITRTFQVCQVLRPRGLPQRDAVWLVMADDSEEHVGDPLDQLDNLKRLSLPYRENDASDDQRE